jgi:hypothetical protein
VSSKADKAATKSIPTALEPPIPSSFTLVSDETIEIAKGPEDAKSKEIEMKGKPLPPSPMPIKDEMKYSPSAKVKKAIQLTRDRMAEVGHPASLHRHRNK